MITYRNTSLPPVWPQAMTRNRKRAPFKTIWSSTLDLLDREIRMLRGRNIELAVDVQDRHLRADGMLRADARPASPAVIVSFDTPDGRLTFPCDTFSFWQDNVGAIARALEDLRRVERYGVKKGAQYAGFKALPATTAPTLSVDAAAAKVAILAEAQAHDARLQIRRDPAAAKMYIRSARARVHPDRRQGDQREWDELEAALSVLQAHFGVSLS